MAKFFAIFLVAILGGEICTAQIVFKDKAGAGAGSGAGSGAVAKQEKKVAVGKEKAAAKDSKDPQARFFPGFGGLSGSGFGGVAGSGGGPFGNFNPCSQCNFRNVRQANECCMRGETQCCQFVSGTGAGFGSNFARPSPFRPGLTNPSFSGQGFSGSAFAPGFAAGSQSFVPGSQGFRPGSQGFRPGSQGFHAGSPGFHPGSQGFIPGSQGFIPGSQGFGPVGPAFGGRPHSNQKLGFCPKPNFIAEALGLRKLDDKKTDGKPSVRTVGAADKPKVKRQAQAGKEKKVDSKSPQARGLLNPFCRDSCFTDFDCPGNLKCCINSQDCRFCTHPVHF